MYAALAAAHFDMSPVHIIRYVGALIFVERDYTFIQAVVFGFAAGLGFTMALILFSGVRERMESCDIPEAFKGMPITLIAASLVSITFIGFAGLIIK